MRTKTLRAADLGYLWPATMPDGQAFTRDEEVEVRLHEQRPNPSSSYWSSGRRWITESECKLAGIPIPDFGDRHWTECILVKGDGSPCGEEVTE